MGLFRDRADELPALQRLVERLKDAVGRQALSAEEWGTAVVAYGLHLSRDPELLSDESLAMYADFVRLVPENQRLASLNRLAGFVMQRKGDGWRALLLYAMGETANAELSARAANLAATCAAPSESVRFTGVQAIVELLARDEAPTAMASAVMSLSDLRFLPLLEPLCRLPLPRLQKLLAELRTTLNSLSAACMLHLLETRPELSQDISAALARLALHTSLVADVVLPVPTWAYEKPTPQPLHAWELPEFFPRMLPRLEPHLSSAQLDCLRKAFTQPATPSC